MLWTWFFVSLFTWLGFIWFWVKIEDFTFEVASVSLLIAFTPLVSQAAVIIIIGAWLINKLKGRVLIKKRSKK